MQFKDDDARALIRKTLPAGSAGFAQLDQLSFQSFTDLEQSLKEDVEVPFPDPSSRIGR